VIQALLKKGRVSPVDVPAPVAGPGCLLVKTVRSCISVGTESAMLAGSGRSLIRKALDQPAKVALVLRMARTEGLARTVAEVRGALALAEPVGYSLAGVVAAVGPGVTDFAPGDRVAAAGQGIANHAEYVDVPVNLAVPLPEGLDFDAAATVTLGAIAMQGVRRADVRLGEFAVVFGVGILGQLAAQMLSAAGARVLAVDIDPARLALARELGAEAGFTPGEAASALRHLTGGHGADVTVFCAATDDPKALSQALSLTRKKGRLVMVGSYGRELDREGIYKKEIDFLISCSYGPGRYDEEYERRGLDYPYAYVRWTENRNMAEYLRLTATGRIRVAPLIQGVFPIAAVADAFASLKGPTPPLMTLLDYGETPLPGLAPPPRRVDLPCPARDAAVGRIRVGLIGAGTFAVGYHLPNLAALGDRYALRAVCNRTGATARSVAERFGAAYATTDHREILDDPEIDLVMICTRHNQHGSLVLESLAAGKHTFVEKPLCTRPEELTAIREFYAARAGARAPLLAVGFNRRFSPYATAVAPLARARINPLFLRYSMNAGYIPPDHWFHGPQGGGRIVGEACHAVDFCSFLVGAPVRAWTRGGLRPKTDSLCASDNMTLLLEYEDGSLATIEYFAVGSRECAKEEIAIRYDGKTLVIDDFTALAAYGERLAPRKTTKPEKGLLEELTRLADCLGDPAANWPIPLECMLETTEITLDAAAGVTIA
jgi:predicted dehydrogenase/threonine dehydrogenase-like Zn-dependent dehydrogenase